MIATRPHDILGFLDAEHVAGHACVVVTLIGVEGSSSRATGAQMAVSADGRAIGSFSGGCIEAAVVREALDVLAAGTGRVVRYGSGSPYIDIRLPCGGGIDLLFTPRPDAAVVAQALNALAARRAVTLFVDAHGLSLGAENDAARFALRLVPPLRIIALGQGEDVSAFARFAHAFGADVAALTPDPVLADALAKDGIDARHLAVRTQLPAVAGDAWTAIVFLFHDRDWEEHLLPQALALPGFYHGAIGSPRTHHARMAALEAAGVSPDHLTQLRGMIGLIPSTRDPATLALSVLGEIVQAYQACG